MARRFPVSSDKRFKSQPAFGPDAIDLGTPERRRHGRILLERQVAGGPQVARAAAACMLDQLQQLGQVTPVMHNAGLRLRRDYQHGRIEPRTVMRYAPTAVQGGGWNGFERSEKEELAYKDWRIALQVVGVGMSEALVSVCCLDLHPLPRQRRALLDGLEALIAHYGLR